MIPRRYDSVIREETALPEMSVSLVQSMWSLP